MSREKQGFHDNMVMLNEMFPDKGMLNQKEVAQFIGCHRTTVANKIKFNATTKLVSKADLARQISV